MPYENGRRVSMERWRLLHPMHRLWAGSEEQEEPEPEVPVEPEVKPKTKSQAVKAAVKAATGVDLDDYEGEDEPA